MEGLSFAGSRTAGENCPGGSHADVPGMQLPWQPRSASMDPKPRPIMHVGHIRTFSRVDREPSPLPKCNLVGGAQG